MTIGDMMGGPDDFADHYIDTCAMMSELIRTIGAAEVAKLIRRRCRERRIPADVANELASPFEGATK